MNILAKGNYYGSKKKELLLDGIIMSEYSYHVAQTDWHYHENPYFMYTLQGNLFDINKKIKSVCPPGSLLFHNWQEQHYNKKESHDAKGFHIEFDRSWFKEQQLSSPLWSGSEKLDHPFLHQLIGKLYYEFHINDEFSALGIESTLLALCENIESNQLINTDKNPAWIEPLKELLNDGTDTLSLKMLSKQLDVHPVHLSRSIPKYFGVTLSEYLRQLKIKKALIYLADKKYSLTQISYICGFYDQSHFTGLFKSYFGMTPGKYRLSVTQ